MPVAVASDYDRVEERLAAIGLDPSRFNLCASAEQVGRLKPDPLVFSHIFSKLQVDPRHCMIVGDRHDTDGIAAARLDCKFYCLKSEKGWEELKLFLQMR